MGNTSSATATLVVATFLALSCSKPELPPAGLPGVTPPPERVEPGRNSMERSADIAAELDAMVDKWQEKEHAVLEGGVPSRLHALTIHAAQNLATSNNPNGQISMARSRLNRVLVALKQRGTRKDGQLIVTDADLTDALAWLCPLYPFC